jgi:hypothetical protein
MSAHALLSGFQIGNSGRIAYRKHRGVSSFDLSQKDRPAERIPALFGHGGEDLPVALDD